MNNWDLTKETKQKLNEVTGKMEDKKIENKKPEIQFKTLAEAGKGRGLKIGIYGNYSTGKTHFALTAKEPIFILDSELGAAPLVHQFKGKDIRVLDIMEDDGVISYEKYVNAIEYISQQDKVGTVVIDSITDVWSFAQEYGKVKVFKIKPEQRLAQQWDWNVINSLYLKPLKRLLRLNCNLILVAREQETYQSAGNPTGKFNPHWMKKTGFLVDYVLYNTKRIDKVGNLSFNTKIDKSRAVGKITGKNFANLTFDKLKEELEKFKEVIK